jgi:hypothetical protein
MIASADAASLIFLKCLCVWLRDTAVMTMARAEGTKAWMRRTI